MANQSLNNLPKTDSGRSQRFWRFDDKVLQFYTTSTVDTKRVRTKLRYKYILVFFLALCILFTSIAISGCSSSGYINNYLLEARYNPYGMSEPFGPGVVNKDAYDTLNSNIANKSDMTVRIGYFGTCAYPPTQSQPDDFTNWYCARNVSLITELLSVPTQDPFNLIYLMNNIRTHHINPAILIVSVCVTFIALLVLILADLQNARLYFVSTWLSVFACFLGLIGMVWQQSSVDTAARVIENLSNNSITTHAGPAPAGLGWTSIFVLFCSGIGIVVLVMSERKTLSIIGDMDPQDLANISGTLPMAEQESKHTVPKALSIAGSRGHHQTRESQSSSDLESHRSHHESPNGGSPGHVAHIPYPYPIDPNDVNMRIPHSYE